MNEITPTIEALRKVQAEISRLSEKMDRSNMSGEYKLSYFQALTDVSLAVSDVVIDQFTTSK